MSVGINAYRECSNVSVGINAYRERSNVSVGINAYRERWAILQVLSQTASMVTVIYSCPLFTYVKILLTFETPHTHLQRSEHFMYTVISS